MRLRRVRVWKQIGGFVQTLNCALRQMLDTRKWEQRRKKEGKASADQYSFRFKNELTFVWAVVFGTYV